MELSTTRVAWNEITDNVERGASPSPSPVRCNSPCGANSEAVTHTAFVESISTHVIDPLSNFKVRVPYPDYDRPPSETSARRRSRTEFANASETM